MVSLKDYTIQIKQRIMKKIIFTFLAIACLIFFANAQQVSLYDSEGEARAYIDFDEEATIFMWDGTPVAFLEKDGSDICVFGYNGCGCNPRVPRAGSLGLGR